MDMKAGRPELITQVLITPAAKLAFAATGVDPGNAYAISDLEIPHIRPHCFNGSHNFMTQYNGKPRRDEPSLNLIEFRMADPAGGDSHEKLFVVRFWLRQLCPFQWFCF
jgi:hypothetical protein